MKEAELKALRIARAEAGMTLGELAEKSGVALNTISRIERGAQEPQAGTLHKLAAALEVRTADLLSEGVTLKAGAPEPPDTFVDRLLRAPSMPVEELSDEDLADVRRVLAGGKPIARFVEEDPDWLRQLSAYLAEENFRRAVGDASTETLGALVVELVAGDQPRLFDDEQRKRTPADVLYKRSVRFARALIVREELLRRGAEPPENRVLALRRYMNALELSEDPALGRYRAEQIFSPDQVAEWLVEDEQDNERIKEVLAKLSPEDRAALMAAPGMSRLSAAYAKAQESRDAAEPEAS